MKKILQIATILVFFTLLGTYVLYNTGYFQTKEKASVPSTDYQKGPEKTLKEALETNEQYKKSNPKPNFSPVKSPEQFSSEDSDKTKSIVSEDKIFLPSSKSLIIHDFKLDKPEPIRQMDPVQELNKRDTIRPYFPSSKSGPVFKVADFEKRKNPTLTDSIKKDSVLKPKK